MKGVHNTSVQQKPVKTKPSLGRAHRNETQPRLLSIQPSPKSRAATKYLESERRAAAAKARGRGRRHRGRRRAEQRCSLQVPFQGGGGALPAGPAKGGGGGAPGVVQRPQGQGLQPGLLHRAPPPPRPAPHRGPHVAAASPTAAGPRDLPQRGEEAIVATEGATVQGIWDQILTRGWLIDTEQMFPGIKVQPFFHFVLSFSFCRTTCVRGCLLLH